MDSVVESDWLLVDASVRGKGHIDAGLPNQDAIAIATSRDGKIVAAVVSDGAGTASKAEVGSRAAADRMAPWLLKIGQQIHAGQIHASMARDHLLEGIVALRRHLDPSGMSLRDYHCTLVGCLLTPSGGFVCQIGDSIAVAARFALLGDGSDDPVDFFPDDGCRRYEPERGEYSNETHFITETDWEKHLRITPLPDSFDAIVLMTDGAMDVVTLRGRIFRGFMSNLFGRILRMSDRHQRNELLHGWLADKQTYGVTGDDKTLFVAIRASSQPLARRPVFVEPGKPELAQSIASAQGLGDSTAEPEATPTAPHQPMVGSRPKATQTVTHPAPASLKRYAALWLLLAAIASVGIGAGGVWWYFRGEQVEATELPRHSSQQVEQKYDQPPIQEQKQEPKESIPAPPGPKTPDPAPKVESAKVGANPTNKQGAISGPRNRDRGTVATSSTSAQQVPGSTSNSDTPNAPGSKSDGTHL